MSLTAARQKRMRRQLPRLRPKAPVTIIKSLSTKLLWSVRQRRHTPICRLATADAVLYGNQTSKRAPVRNCAPPAPPFIVDPSATSRWPMRKITNPYWPPDRTHLNHDWSASRLLHVKMLSATLFESDLTKFWANTEALARGGFHPLVSPRIWAQHFSRYARMHDAAARDGDLPQRRFARLPARARRPRAVGFSFPRLQLRCAPGFHGGKERKHLSDANMWVSI
jgi:hypothetical protein